MTGTFIVLEGPEGAGKSTQAARLARWLRSRGLCVVETREPGGTPIGEQIRSILLDPANRAMLAETEALLYAAARAQHVAEVLRPALASGAVIVCDRYLDSSIAYQGGGRGLPRGPLQALQRFATGGLAPDLRLLLDVSTELGLKRRFRAAEDVNRLDLAETEFHVRVRRAFLAMARADPAGWVVIDASDEVDRVSQMVFDAISERLGSRLSEGNPTTKMDQSR